MTFGEMMVWTSVYAKVWTKSLGSNTHHRTGQACRLADQAVAELRNHKGSPVAVDCGPDDMEVSEED